MQEYMLQKRGVKSVEAPEKDKVMKSIRAIINEKEEQKLQKKNAVFMYGIIGFVCCWCRWGSHAWEFLSGTRRSGRVYVPSLLVH